MTFLTDPNCITRTTVTMQSAPVILPDTYKFTPKCGWVWLQKICFWFLRKIKANHIEITTKYIRRHNSENEEILKSLLGQQGYWLQFVHDYRKPLRIVMGPDDFDGLLEMAQMGSMRPFDLSAGLEIRDINGPHWHNIPITVIPWMKGAVIVPDHK